MSTLQINTRSWHYKLYHHYMQRFARWGNPYIHPDTEFEAIEVTVKGLALDVARSCLAPVHPDSRSDVPSVPRCRSPLSQPEWLRALSQAAAFGAKGGENA